MRKIILVCVMALLSACEKPVESVTPPRPALVIKVGDNTAINQNMVLVGEVKSRYESNIGFRIAGKIIKRDVDVGTQVKKGQVIASIDAIDANLSAQAAKADVQAAEASYALAKAELERQRQLYEKKFISKSALDMREAEFKTSTARLAQVKAQAAVSGNQSHYTHLIADRSGVISKISAEPGQVVEAGQTVAQIVDYAFVEVAVAVPESQMANIKVGDMVLVKLWANSEKTYQAKVREIAPAANSDTRAFDVRVSVLNPDSQLRIGMTAGVAFGGVSTTKSLIVPSAALTRINGVNTVWVISPDGVATPRTVTSGAFTEDGIEVTSGLQAGEVVAVAGVHTLIKGQHVRPQVVTTESVH
ncbi:MAG: efflux RND transporter periplasmic adaptor subunit [Methylophilus sp.]|nr:efflux RND transporter periplasmic adaptor subunit [Methylophilus sp.]